MYWEKEKVYWGEEKGTLRSKNDNYVGTKFECYKVKYFGTEGVGYLHYYFNWFSCFWNSKLDY
jgi:hypothetical protein